MRYAVLFLICCFGGLGWSVVDRATVHAGPTAIEPPKPVEARWTEDFIESIGFVIKLHYRTDEFVTMIEPILLETGVRYVRDGGTKRGVVDNAKRLYRDHGIRFTMVADPRDKIWPENVVDRLIAPFDGAVVAVEGPNEWDNRRNIPIFDGLVWPEHMQKYQRDLYEAIKSHPDEEVRGVMVLSPSLAHPHRAAKELGDLTAYIDAVNLHPYQGGALPMDQWDTKWLPGALGTSADKPIIVTETGYHYVERASGQPGITDRAGARYLPRLFLDMFAAGVMRTHYYNLSADKWGDVRSDGTPRPGVAAVGRMIRILEDPPTDGRRPYEAHRDSPYTATPLAFHIDGGDEDLRRHLFQKRDGRHYLVLYFDKKSYDPKERVDLYSVTQTLTLRLAEPADEVKHFDPLVSAEAQGRFESTDEVVIGVSDSPIILEITPRKGLP
jgi:hypothetical protein